MQSIFQKLIKRELGNQNYNRYFKYYENWLVEKKEKDCTIYNQEIYKDIYSQLQHIDSSMLKERIERLVQAMILSFHISKRYIFSLFVYFIGGFFLISRNLAPEITITALILMSICFLYKTCEYAVNRFCYIDARIILIYKGVLDKLIEKCKENNCNYEED